VISTSERAAIFERMSDVELQLFVGTDDSSAEALPPRLLRRWRMLVQGVELGRERLRCTGRDEIADDRWRRRLATREKTRAVTSVTAA
jgi:hypothetical protein